MAKAKKALKVDSKGKVAELEKILKSGVTFVLIYADWCGHCHKYMDNVWNPMCKKGNMKHNVAAVREDVLPNTSLANAKIDGYPSVIVVNSDGKAEEFKKPDGEVTNAMPNKEKIQEAVNTPITEVIEEEEEIPEQTVYPNNMPMQTMPKGENLGKKYIPTPLPISNIQRGVFTPPQRGGAYTVNMPADSSCLQTNAIRQPLQSGGAYEQSGGAYALPQSGGGLLFQTLKKFNMRVFRKTRKNRKVNKRKTNKNKK